MRRSGSWRSRREIALAVLAASLAGGCNAVIGIRDVPPAYDATAEAATTVAEAGDGPPSGQDAGGSDAGVEADLDAEASVSAEASPCGDTQSTATNCGGCGHDCLGGSCVKGACQPVLMVPFDAGASPYALAQDDKAIYWSDNFTGYLYRTDKISFSIAEVNLSGDLFINAIVVDDGGLYWGDAFRVSTCDLHSCTVSTSAVAAISQSGVTSLAVGPDSVYWSEGNAAVLRASRTGTQQNAVTFWQGDADVENVATDGQRVYFTAVDGVLRAVGVDGGAALTLGVPGTRDSFGVALDDAGVYWTVNDPSQGVIDRSGLATLSATTLASGQSYPTNIATDGTSLYWIAYSAGANETTVVGCTIASCMPKVLATIATNNLNAIVVDDLAIYVTQPGGTASGGIWKLAK